MSTPSTTSETTTTNDDGVTSSVTTQAAEEPPNAPLHCETTTTTASNTTEHSSNRRKRPRVEDSVRAMLEATGSCVYSTTSFLNSYVPALPPLEPRLESLGLAQEESSANELILLFKETLLTPNDADLEPLTKLRIPTSCTQSLSSLIQDCVWTLVQRRDSHRNARKLFLKHNNLLCQGYVVAEQQQRCNLLSQRQLNAGTDYCKTSPLFQTLHTVAGDDVVRYILLNTCIFLPVLNEGRDCVERGNYWQVAGPPLTFWNLATKQQPSRSLKRIQQQTSLQDSDSAGSFTESKEPAVVTAATARKHGQRRKRKRPIRCLQTLTAEPNHPLSPQSCLHRKSLFYSNTYTKTVGQGLLPHEFPVDLWQDMTAEYFETCNKPRNPPSNGALDMCQEILRRHRKADYHRLLQRHCPLPDNYTSASLSALSRHFSTRDGVVAFCQSCVAAVVPSTFWGKVKETRQDPKGKRAHTQPCNSDKVTNETVLSQQILPTFVSLRRNERMANKMLLQNIRATHMTWLSAQNQGGSTTKESGRVNHESLKLLVLSILRWLFHGYVIPLLQQVFYVTESEFHGKRLLFYRKPVWALFRTLSMNKVLGHQVKNGGGDVVNDKVETERVQYTELSECEAAERLLGQKMGLSRLRLVPKLTGVRPIATLNKREIMMLPVHAVARNNMTALEVLEQDDDDTEIDTPFGLARQKRMHDFASAPAAIHTSQPPRVKVSNQSHVPTNAFLGDAFAVLSFEYSRKENSFGSGLMGLHHFYPRYRKFLQQWKGCRDCTSSCQRRKLYFGSVDIRHCYDNINQDHLLAVVDKILTDEDYVIQKYSVSHPVDADSSCRMRRQQKKDVGLPEQFEPFSHKVRVLAKEHHGCVFVDGVNFVAISKQLVMDQLREHLTSHMVVIKGRHRNRYLLQSTGIPQGSILSSLLCNFYYGDVEQRLLDPPCSPTRSVSSSGGSAKQNDSADGDTDSALDLLARMVDDFLLITTELGDLESFFTTMHRGDATLGVEINKEKTNASVSLKIPSCHGTSDELAIEASADLDFFPWCGMLFSTSSGEVRIDYSRFVDEKGGDGLTVERVSQEGEQLLVQMKRFVRPRCIPILFDPSINPQKAQVINFYQLMAFAAVKTADYLMSLGDDLAPTSRVRTNPQFLVSSIKSTIDFAYQLIKSKLQVALQEVSVEGSMSGLLKPAVADWIGWRAFYDVLQQVPHSDFQSLADSKLAVKLGQARSNVAGSKQHQGLEKTITLALEDIELARLMDVSASLQ